MEEHVQITLDAIDKARKELQSTRERLIGLNKANQEAARAANEAGRAYGRNQEKLGRLVRTIGRGTTALRTMGRRLRGIGAGMLRLGRSITGVLNPLNSLIAGFVAFESVRRFTSGIVSANQELERINRMLRFVEGSQKAADRTMQGLADTANRFGQPLGLVADQYAKINAVTKGTQLEGKATTDVFEGMLAASVRLGLGGEQLRGALTAVEQIISKGKLSAEEIRGQMGERLPGAFRVAADAMNVTEKELNKLLETGQVTAQEFIPAFGRELQARFGGDLTRATQSSVFEINRLQNAVLQLRRDIGEAGFMRNFTRTVRQLTRVVSSVSFERMATSFGEAISRITSQVPAFISLISEAFEQGRLKEVLSLTIQAGIEQGFRGAAGLVKSIGPAIGTTLFEVLSKAMVSVIEFVTIQFRRAFAQIGAFFATVLKTAIGEAKEAADSLLRATSFGAINLGLGQGKQSFSEVLAEESERANQELAKNTQGVRQGAQAIREAIGNQLQWTEETEGTSSASERLAELLREQQEKLAEIRETTQSAKQEDEGRRKENDKTLESLRNQNQQLQARSQYDDPIGPGLNQRQRRRFSGAIFPAEGLENVNRELERMQSSGQVIETVLGGTFRGLSNNISKLIMEARNLNQFFVGVARSIAQAFVQAFADMLAAFIVRQTTMLALNATGNAQLVAQEQAASATVASTWLPAALVKSVGTFGAAAIVGAAALAAVVAGYGIAGGFAEGGVVPGNEPTNKKQDNKVITAQSGEGIVPLDAMKKLGPARFELIRRGEIPAFAEGGVVGDYQAGMTPSPSVGDGIARPQEPSQVNVQPAEVQVGVLNNMDQMRQFLESTPGEKKVVDIVKKRKIDIGIPT